MKDVAGGSPAPGVLHHQMMFAMLLWLVPLPGTQAATAQCNPVVEARAEQGWFRVRPHVDAFTQCTLTRGQLAALLQEFLGRTESLTTPFHSLFLGRLVDHPWLSRYLAERALADPNWDAESGRPRTGEINAFVRTILTSADAIALLQSLFDGTGYTVTGVSVEKVLVMPANGIAWLDTSRTGLVPFDALTHVTLERVQGLNTRQRSSGYRTRDTRIAVSASTGMTDFNPWRANR